MQDTFKTKHLTFSRLPLQIGRKTSRWSVLNHHYGEQLGEICWYAPWRQYCFFGGELVFSQSCLTDIAQMIARLTAAREQPAQKGERRCYQLPGLIG